MAPKTIGTKTSDPSNLCGRGEYPKTFLIKGMKPYGKEIK